MRAFPASWTNLLGAIGIVKHRRKKSHQRRRTLRHGEALEARQMLAGDQTEIYFDQVVYASEGDGYVVLEIAHVIDSGVVTVDYTTVPGTAASPDDYPYQGGQITFDSGGDPVYITIPIVDDMLDEEDEGFTVVLSNPSSNAVIIEDTAVVIISDDDESPVEDDPILCLCDCGCPVVGTTDNGQTGDLGLNVRTPQLLYSSTATPTRLFR